MTFYKEQEEAKLMLLLKEIDNITLSNYLKCVGKKEQSLIQMKVYIASQLGVDLGFDFDFYIKGPFSIELLRVVNRIKIKKTPLYYYTKLYKMKNNAKDKISKTKYLFAVPKELNMDIHQWLLIISAMLYLYDVGRNMDFVFENMEKKKIATVEEMNIAISRLSKIKYFDNVFLNAQNI